MSVKIDRLDSWFSENIPFIASLFRGMAQIMLQERVLTGILFLIGIFYGSPVMAAGALLAVLSGTLTAKLLKYDANEILQGLYGFSAALVGVALILFYKPVFLVWVFIVVGSAGATVMQHFFIVRKIPVFTLPFVLVTWLIMFLFQNIIPIDSSSILETDPVIFNNLLYIFLGYGQVIFQGTLFAGIIFFIAVLISSPLAAFFGLAAAVIAGVTSSYIGVSIELIGMGLLSYNAVLCAIVFKGRRLENFAWLILSTLLSVVIYIWMIRFSFTPLTFPFVAATIITLIIKNISQKLSMKNNRQSIEA